MSILNEALVIFTMDSEFIFEVVHQAKRRKKKSHVLKVTVSVMCEPAASIMTCQINICSSDWDIRLSVCASRFFLLLDFDFTFVLNLLLKVVCTHLTIYSLIYSDLLHIFIVLLFYFRDLLLLFSLYICFYFWTPVVSGFVCLSIKHFVLWLCCM